MFLNIKPTKHLRGKIVLPSSKSYSIRAFMVAACGGRSTIFHPSNCDDAKVAITVAKLLGSRIVRLAKNKWKVVARANHMPLRQVNVKESGTVLRFLIPLLSLQNTHVIISGEGTLKGRPNDYLVQTLRRMGLNIAGKGKIHSIPVAIDGGSLKGGLVNIDASISSQFVSSLLITLPQLNEDSRLRLSGQRLVSSDYITMTRKVLQRCGVRIDRRNDREYLVKGRQKFKGLKSFHVPSDYGLTAYHLAAAALVNSEINLEGDFDPLLPQADGRILPILKQMGVKWNKNKNNISLQGPFALTGGDFSLKECPDLVPIVTVLALFAKGNTRLSGIAHARVKESDRISDLRRELIKIGAKIKEAKGEMIIYPQPVYRSGCTLDPAKDHRLAMAFSVLGLKVGLCVKDIECCAKSYPDFVKDFKSLRAMVELD